jgi:ATP-dependent Clp protease ATP-binding subunit ClpC
MPKLKLKRGLLSISLSALIVLSREHASAFNNNIVRVSSSSPTLQVLPAGTGLTSRGSFVPTNVRATRALYSRSSSSSALHMVIERLSDECVEAVKQSHEIGNEIGLKELKNEILFAGIVARPERAANTLERFQIQADDVRATAIRVVRAKPSSIGAKPESPSENIALPFADDTKTTLSRACEIADRMESQLVRSEHVLLALLGYNNGQKIVTSSVIDVLSGLEAVKNGKTKVSVFDFCEQLVNALPNTPFDQPDTRVRENVVIGGASGNTNTLKEVGVDMTQLALEGRLDMVFGRDKEIRSALRTLGRRRKNNPCLIGDAGTYMHSAVY